MTRARVEKPNHWPPGSRRFSGIRCCSVADFTGWSRPSCSARQSRTARAFVPDALDQRVFARFDAVDLDSSELREALVKGFVGLVMPRRVNVYYLLLPCGACRGEQEDNAAESLF